MSWIRNLFTLILPTHNDGNVRCGRQLFQNRFEKLFHTSGVEFRVVDSIVTRFETGVFNGRVWQFDADDPSAVTGHHQSLSARPAAQIQDRRKPLRSQLTGHSFVKDSGALRVDFGKKIRAKWGIRSRRSARKCATRRGPKRKATARPCSACADCQNKFEKMKTHNSIIRNTKFGTKRKWVDWWDKTRGNPSFVPFRNESLPTSSLAGEWWRYDFFRRLIQNSVIFNFIFLIW